MTQQRAVETLQALDNTGIEYCVLRNFDFATGGSIDGDVDVLVREQQREEVFRVLEKEGFHPKQGDTSRQTLFRRYVPEERDLLLIDIYWDGPTYNGLPILDGEQTLDNRERYPADDPAGSQIYVPRDEEYFVELVFHGALNKNRYREFYREELDRLRAEVDPATVLSHARDLFGVLGRRAMQDALDGNFERVVDRKWRLVLAGCRQNALLVLLLVWNLLVLRNVVRPLRSFVRRHRPGRPAPVVALLGPDGAGKTSVAEGVAQALQAAGFDSRVAALGVYNDETKLMSLATEIDGGDGADGTADDDDSDSETPNGGSRSLGSRRSPAVGAVHLLDIWLRVRNARAAGDIVIADRYAHDILLYDNPGPLRRLFQRFERPPFLGIVLAGPVSVVAARSEYDEESVGEMYSRLDELEFPRVDVDQPVDDVVTDVLELLADEQHLYYEFD